MFQKTDPETPGALRSASRYPERVVSRLILETLSREQQVQIAKIEAIRNVGRNRSTALRGIGS